MNELVIFKFEGNEVRTHVEGDRIEWSATDVCRVLGYANPWDAIINHCKERGVAKREVPHPQSPNKTIEMTFINESNLYRLIMRSRMPDAESFQDWVTEEVLPSIRKTGKYAFKIGNTMMEVSAEIRFNTVTAKICRHLINAKYDSETVEQFYAIMNSVKPELVQVFQRSEPRMIK